MRPLLVLALSLVLVACGTVRPLPAAHEAPAPTGGAPTGGASVRDRDAVETVIIVGAVVALVVVAAVIACESGLDCGSDE